MFWYLAPLRNTLYPSTIKSLRVLFWLWLALLPCLRPRVLFLCWRLVFFVILFLECACLSCAIAIRDCAILASMCVCNVRLPVAFGHECLVCACMSCFRKLNAVQIKCGWSGVLTWKYGAKNRSDKAVRLRQIM